MQPICRHFISFFQALLNKPERERHQLPPHERSKENRRVQCISGGQNKFAFVSLLSSSLKVAPVQGAVSVICVMSRRVILASASKLFFSPNTSLWWKATGISREDVSALPRAFVRACVRTCLTAEWAQIQDVSLVSTKTVTHQVLLQVIRHPHANVPH